MPGVILYSLALASVTLTTGSLLAWSLVAVATLPVMVNVWTTAVVSRFDASRGLALAMTLCGVGLGGSILPVLTDFLINRFGWRAAFLAVSIGGLLLLPLVVLFFRGAHDRQRSRHVEPKSARPKYGAEFPAAIRSLTFFRLAPGGLISVLCVTALLIHIVPILRSLGCPRPRQVN